MSIKDYYPVIERLLNDIFITFPENVKIEKVAETKDRAEILFFVNGKELVFVLSEECAREAEYFNIYFGLMSKIKQMLGE